MHHFRICSSFATEHDLIVLLLNKSISKMVLSNYFFMSSTNFIEKSTNIHIYDTMLIYTYYMMYQRVLIRRNLVV